MNGPHDKRVPYRLAACGGALVFGSICLSWLSRDFAYESIPAQRPLIGMVLLLTVMFVVHWIGFRIALGRERTSRRAVAWLIVTVAVAARLAMLPSHPIQELDLYRYLWDGQASVSGISPFRYPPEAVVKAIDQGTSDDRLAILARRAHDDPAVETILRRVHYSELPTVYPIVSQFVFEWVARLTPPGAPVVAHVIAMKAAIVAFDLATLAVLFWLLRITCRHPAWAILYAWNPLVLKEFAGSGHLDSIAVFFTIYAVAVAANAIASRRPGQWSVAAILLGLGFGAKLYPLLLFPVIVVAAWRNAGIRRAITTAILFLAVATISLAPWWASKTDPKRTESATLFRQSPGASARDLERDRAPHTTLVSQAHPALDVDAAPDGNRAAVAPEPDPPLPELAPPLPGSAPPHSDRSTTLPRTEPYDLEPPVFDSQSDRVSTDTAAGRTTDGIEAFLTRWEMNDLVFLLIIENVRPGDSDVWFCVTTKKVRDLVGGGVARRLETTDKLASFLLARTITLAVFAAFGLWFLCRMRANSAAELCRTSFLILAIFWLLAPTLNPWYWIWALPLIPFAKSRGWILVSAMLAIYYLRFWFVYHTDSPLMQLAPYPGAQTFDFVVVFLEHVPWMTLVATQAIRRASRRPK